MNADEFNTKIKIQDKIVLVDFMAEWCGPCRALGPVLDNIAKANPNVELLKIDIDDHEELAERYSVMSVPTLVFMKDGAEVNRVVGLTPRARLEELIEKYK